VQGLARGEAFDGVILAPLAALTGIEHERTGGRSCARCRRALRDAAAVLFREADLLADTQAGRGRIDVDSWDLPLIVGAYFLHVMRRRTLPAGLLRPKYEQACVCRYPAVIMQRSTKCGTQSVRTSIIGKKR